MYNELIKMTATGLLRKKAKDLKKKDANATGSDDAGGRALEAIAEGIDSIDLSGATNPKSLKNIGETFIAVGEKLVEESAKAAKEG